MTRIRPESPVKRQTEALERTDPITVTLHPKYVTIGVKGKRESYNVPYDELLAWARKREWLKNGGRR